MKEGDEVEFNNLAPAYITRQLNKDTYKAGYIDENGWVFLSEDPGNPKMMIHQKWLKVVKEA
jgi:hypothetical protein